MPISELLLRLLIPAVLAVSVVYAGLSALRAQARKRAGRPARAAGVTSMAEWRRMSTVEQEAADTAALDLAEQADLDAEDDAREAARAVVERSRVNSLFHP